MWQFPGSNLCGTVVEIIKMPGTYPSRVVLANADEIGWGYKEKTFVDTTIPPEELVIKAGDLVSCRCFEHMGSDQVEGHGRLAGYEMTRGFTIVSRG